MFADKNVIGLFDLILSLLGGAVVYLVLGHKSNSCTMDNLTSCEDVFHSYGIQLIFKVRN